MKFPKQQPPSTNVVCCTCKSQLLCREHAQVRVQILEQVSDQDETRRVQQVLSRLKFVTRPNSSTDLEPASEAELDRIALLYAQGGPLSEVIIADRESR